MTVSTDASIRFTLTDIDVGLRLFEALAQRARLAQGAPIGYGELLTLARGLHPRDATLGRAVPVGIGMKLRFVEAFCLAHGFPNLACLATNSAGMRPGPGYQGNWETDRRAVADFDWWSAEAPLAAYASAARAAVPKHFKPRKERPADVTWYAYFCSHREACAKITGDDKKEIINLLMAGLDPETALNKVLGAKAEFGEAA